MSGEKDAALFQFSLLSIVKDNIQLHSSVKKMQGWGFVYIYTFTFISSLPCLQTFGIPYLHLFTFLIHFFSCIHNVSCYHALLCNLSLPCLSPSILLIFSIWLRRDPSIGCRRVLSAAFCSIWRHFEGLNKAGEEE